MSTFDIVRAMGSRRRPRWRAAGALTLARGARCECSHRAFAANLVRDGGGMAEDSRRVCTHRESSAMDVAATATVRLATCANVGDASTCRRWPAPQIAHIGPSPPPRLGARVRPARRARGVTRTRLHSLALCRPRLRRKPRPACTRGMDFLLAEKRRCPANRRNVSAERADVGNLPTCVHAGGAFWHPRSCTGTSCLRSRPACTHGTRFPTRGRSWPPVNRGDAPTGQDHVRSLVLCVHAGRGFCRWEERHPAPLSFSPSWIFSAS